MPSIILKYLISWIVIYSFTFKQSYAHIPHINISTYLNIIKFQNQRPSIMLMPLRTLLIFAFVVCPSYNVMDVIGLESSNDVSHQIFMQVIGPLLNTTYLGLFNGQITTEYNGIIWGYGGRAYVALPVRLNHIGCPSQINVIFKVDTGAPISTLTSEAVNKLFQNCKHIQKITSGMYYVQIAGRQLHVSESQAYYKNFNILGADFMQFVNGRLEVNYSKYLPETLRLSFDINVYQQEEL